MFSVWFVVLWYNKPKNYLIGYYNNYVLSHRLQVIEAVLLVRGSVNDQLVSMHSCIHGYLGIGSHYFDIGWARSLNQKWKLESESLIL